MRKLAIVGTHSSTRDQAPFDDLDFDIWVYNEAPQAEWCKRWTACFQIHDPSVYMSANNFVNKQHWDWLQQDHGKRIIWMQDYDELVPNSRRFPIAEMISTMPSVQPVEGETFFESTAAMSLALALYLKYDYIVVYGVDLSSGTEYAYQQNNWMYWSGVARSMLGNNFVIKSGLQHFIKRLYGYEGETQIERSHFQKRAEFWNAEKRTHENRMYKLRNSLRDAITDREYEKFSDMIVDAQNTAQLLGEAVGALQEAQNYAGRADPISRQQFERRGAQAQEDGDKARAEMDKESGKLEYVWNAWRLTGDPNAAKQVRAFYANLIDLALKTGGNLGVWRENARYMVEYDNRVTAAGGERTLKALGMMQ